MPSIQWIDTLVRLQENTMTEDTLLQEYRNVRRIALLNEIVDLETKLNAAKCAYYELIEKEIKGDAS